MYGIQKAPAREVAPRETSAISNYTRSYRVTLEYFVLADSQEEAEKKAFRNVEDKVYPFKINTPQLATHIEGDYQYDCKGEGCEICIADNQACGHDQVVDNG